MTTGKLCLIFKVAGSIPQRLCGRKQYADTLAVEWLSIPVARSDILSLVCLR